MEPKVFEALSKPITKLIECVAKGIGVVYEPAHLRRKAIANAAAFKLQVETIEASLVSSPEATAIVLTNLNNNLELGDVEKLAKRAQTRIAHRDLQEQENLESIVAESIKYLGTTVAKEDVDPDWRTRFFNKAKDITSEEMREVWSKILAGEVTKPGSFSLRTMELLGNLSQEEAELFRKLSPYVADPGLIILHNNNPAQIGFNHEINFGKILKLQDAGLLMPRDNLELTQHFEPRHAVAFKFSHGLLVFRSLQEKALDKKIQILKLTAPGEELVKLINSVKWDTDYVEQLKSKYSGFEIEYVAQKGD